MARYYYKDEHNKFIGKAEYERAKESDIAVRRVQGKSRIPKRDLIVAEYQLRKRMSELVKLEEKAQTKRDKKIQKKIKRLKKAIPKAESKVKKAIQKREKRLRPPVEKPTRESPQHDIVSIKPMKSPIGTYLRFSMKITEKESRSTYKYLNGVKVIPDRELNIRQIGSMTKPENFNSSYIYVTNLSLDEYDTEIEYKFYNFQVVRDKWRRATRQKVGEVISKHIINGQEINRRW